MRRADWESTFVQRPFSKIFFFNPLSSRKEFNFNCSPRMSCLIKKIKGTSFKAKEMHVGERKRFEMGREICKGIRVRLEQTSSGFYWLIIHNRLYWLPIESNSGAAFLVYFPKVPSEGSQTINVRRREAKTWTGSTPEKFPRSLRFLRILSRAWERPAPKSLVGQPSELFLEFPTRFAV